MKLKRLFMHRFLGIGDDPVEIIFPDDCGITHVRGLNRDRQSMIEGSNRVASNAAGKSTIVEGIVFALTGKTLRKLRRGDRIVHNKFDGGCRVEFEYDNIKVVRTIEPNGVEVWVDGINQTINSSKEKTKERIGQIVGVNFDTLCNILIFGQHNMFSFLEAGEPEKRELVEDLLNLQEYNMYEEIAWDKAKECDKTLERFFDKHTNAGTQLAEQQKLLQHQQQQLANYQQNLTSEIERIKRVLATLPEPDALKAQWDAYNKYIEEKRSLEGKALELGEKRNSVAEEISELTEKMRQDMEGRQPLQEKLAAVDSKFVRLEEMRRSLETSLVSIRNDIHQAENELLDAQRNTERSLEAIVYSENWDQLIKQARKAKEDVEQTINNVRSGNLTDKDICPTCFGVIDIRNAQNVIRKLEIQAQAHEDIVQSHRKSKAKDDERIVLQKNEVKKKFFDVKSAIEGRIASLKLKYTEEQSNIETQYSDAKNKIKSLKEAAQKAITDFEDSVKSKYQPSIVQAERERAFIVKQIDHVRQQITKLQTVAKPSVGLDQIGKIEAEKEANQKLLKDKTDSLGINPYAQIIDQLTANVTKIQADIDALSASIKEQEETKAYYEFWVEAFGKEGIKSFIIDLIIPSLNEQIEFWMQTLYDGAISLKFDKLLNVVMVNNSSGNEMIFGQASGGERKRVDIAIMLAFRQIMKMSTGKDPNILFFDEVAENLDEDGVYTLYQTIETIAKTCRLYVITHNQYLVNMLEKADKILMVKQDGCITKE